MRSLSQEITSCLLLATVQCVSGTRRTERSCILSQITMGEGTFNFCSQFHPTNLCSFSIASIDFKPPYVLSGSSDKHLRLLDITTSQGWCTSPDADSNRALATGGVCEACGSTVAPASTQVSSRRGRAHQELVRSVSLNTDFVVSGSYDFTVKVWDRQTGALVADLAGGHVGRIFCVGFDHSKVGCATI